MTSRRLSWRLVSFAFAAGALLVANITFHQDAFAAVGNSVAPKLSAICDAPSYTFELHLRLTPRNIDATQEALVRASFMGGFSKSAMDSKKEDFERGMIRAEELADVSRCLRARADTMRVDVSTVPTVAVPEGSGVLRSAAAGRHTTPTGASSGTPSPDGPALAPVLATLRAAATAFDAGDARTAFHALGGVSHFMRRLGSTTATSADARAASTLYAELTARAFEDGVLRCPSFAHKVPVRFQTPKESASGLSLRHLANLVCVDKRQEVEWTLVALLDRFAPSEASRVLARVSNGVELTTPADALADEIRKASTESPKWRALLEQLKGLDKVASLSGKDLRELKKESLKSLVVAELKASRPDDAGFETEALATLTAWMEKESGK